MQSRCAHPHHLHSAQSLAREGPRLQRGTVPTHGYSPMPPQDSYVDQSRVMIQRSYTTPEAGSNTAHRLGQMDEDSPMAGIEMEDRIITGLDANSSPKWEIIPAMRPLFDSMHPDDRDTFRGCQPHHQHQKSLIDLLNWTRARPNATPPQEMLNALCHSKPGDNSKKRWFCGMKECKKKDGDTLEHLRSHLQSKAHLDKTFYHCDICLNGFHYRHDLNRHKKNKHKGETVVSKGDIPQGHQPGVQRRSSINRPERTSPYQVRHPRRATGREDPSVNSGAGFQASDNAPAATHGPFQSAVSQQKPQPMRRTRSMTKMHQTANNGVINTSHPDSSETRLNEPLRPVNPSYRTQANSHYHNELSVASKSSIPMHAPRTSYSSSSNQATNVLLPPRRDLDSELAWLREYEPPPNSLQPHSNSDHLSHTPLTTAAHNEMDNLPPRSGPRWSTNSRISTPNPIAVVNSNATPQRLQQNAPLSSTQIASEASNPRLSNDVSYATFSASFVFPNDATSRSPSSRDPQTVTFRSQYTANLPSGTNHPFRRGFR